GGNRQAGSHYSGRTTSRGALCRPGSNQLCESYVLHRCSGDRRICANGCRSDGRHGSCYLSLGADYYCESQESEYSLSRGEEDLKMTTVDKSFSQLSSMRDGSLPKQAHSPSRQ